MWTWTARPPAHQAQDLLGHGRKVLPVGDHGAGTTVEGGGGRSLRPGAFHGADSVDSDICPDLPLGGQKWPRRQALPPCGPIIKILLRSPWQPPAAPASPHQPHVKCKCGGKLVQEERGGAGA